MQKRFGELPEWVEKDLARRSETELGDLGVRLLEAGSLEDLLR
ncbi:MAG: hypothetical protein M3Y72_09985 [Acidobacteriota bacterium]|nr:hypothetical protein [Acidobacteriota bacterium]